MLHTPVYDSRLSTFIEQQAKKEPLYYSQSWFDLLTKQYGYSFIPLTTTNADGQITGFLPLCAINSPITGRHLVSLPFSDHCPLLASDEASMNDLIDQAIHLARQQKVKYLELRTGSNEVAAKRTDLVAQGLFVRWQIFLATDPDTIWSKLRKPVQSQIKKSRNLGVTIREAQSHSDVKLYYQLHLQTRSKKHGMPSQPLQFFLQLWDSLHPAGEMKVLLAEHEGRTIAGMVLLISGTTIRYAYGASDIRYLNMAPNNLLTWTAIEWGCIHGYKTLDLGRTACENKGLMEFKRRFGAVQDPLPYYYYPATAGLASTSESSWKFRLLTSCWQKLPLQITGPLGGQIYKYLG